jgi:predicted nucleic acid-binding protein
VIVVDAGVVVAALADDGHDGDNGRRRLRRERLLAPHLIDLEVVSALRRLAATGRLDERRAPLAIDDLRDLPIARVAHAPLIDRCWELRETMTAYDAAYVAVAEDAESLLLTADSRLARDPAPRCDIELLRWDDDL